MAKKSALKIAKRRWFSRKEKAPVKSLEQIIADRNFRQAIEAIKHVASHQELRGGLYAIADAINKAADAMREMRAAGLAIERLADLLAEAKKPRT